MAPPGRHYVDGDADQKKHRGVDVPKVVKTCVWQRLGRWFAVFRVVVPDDEVAHQPRDRVRTDRFTHLVVNT
jgi:hypothetical protein